MADLAVSYTALTGASLDLKRGASELNSTLATLNSAMTPLQNLWTGEAADAYVIANKNWTDAIGKMVTLLDQVSKTVDGSAANYRATDQANAKRNAG